MMARAGYMQARGRNVRKSQMPVSRPPAPGNLFNNGVAGLFP